MAGQVVPFLRRAASPNAIPKDDVYFEMPNEMLDQVRALSEVYIANAALLGIEEFEDYYAYVRMYVHPRFPGRMLVDLDIPREPRVRGCFCVNPVTKKLEKLLDKPLVHFV